jgi:hypothetical protein
MRPTRPLFRNISPKIASKSEKTGPKSEKMAKKNGRKWPKMIKNGQK